MSVTVAASMTVYVLFKTELSFIFFFNIQPNPIMISLVVVATHGNYCVYIGRMFTETNNV